MSGERERVHDDQARREERRPLRVPQPPSTSGLWPSQRRAAERRRTLRRERAVEQWLRRVARR